MKNYLRYLFIAVLALVCGGINAQTYLWQEDFSSYKKDDVPTGGDYDYVCNGTGTKIYTEKLAGGTAPELLVNRKKNEGSFKATIKLTNAAGNATLAYKANRASLSVTATNAEVGVITATGNDYSCPITFEAGATEITITFATTNNENVRLDDIKLFQGDAKKPAGLSWGTASKTVTIGAEDNIFPTLTNAYNLNVTYTSSEPSVATINTEGAITLVAAGKTNITASFAGNDEYEAGEVTYELTVKEAETPDQKITTAANIAEFKALDNGTKAILTLKDAKVQYVNGTSDIYVVDATGGIDIYKSNLTYTAGQILNGTIEATYSEYRKLPELTNITENNLTATDGTVEPIEMTVEEAVKAENVCKLVTVKNITIVALTSGSYTNYYNDEDKTLQIYDKFKLGYTPNTKSAMDYTGIIIPFDSQIELAPTVAPTSTTGISTITSDAAANAPAYNLAGQKVSASYKGVVIKAGKKFVQK